MAIPSAHRLLLVVSLLIQAVALPRYVLAQQSDVSAKIPLGSTLSAIIHSNNSKWLSSSGEFAFGFYEMSPKLYLLGIWFDKFQDKTLVWAANRDDPVDEGSTLNLTRSGNLILFDSRRASKWSANITGSVSGAAMLDDGNFMLVDRSSQLRWQSFDSPTDTLLPGQTLQWGHELISRSTDQNYSSGRFRLILQQDNNLVLYPRVEVQQAYWASRTDNSGSNPKTLMVSQNGIMSLVNSTNTTVVLNNDSGTTAGFHRVTLESDGVLRVYGRNEGENVSWSVLWQLPQNPCDVHSSCGLNGFCTDAADGNRSCECPPGFNFIDTEDPPKGCARNASIGCSRSSAMVPTAKVDWRGEADYAYLNATNESECKQACLEDCDCVAAILGPLGSGPQQCWKKTNPLQDGRQGPEVDRIAFVKVSSDEHYPHAPTSQPHKDQHSRSLLVTGIGLLGCFAVVVSASLIVFVFRYLLSPRIRPSFHGTPGGVQVFSYKEIYAATRGFKEQLGRGAFGTVYKGVLSDGRPIAVKRLQKLLQEGEREFRTEMEIISTTHHKNLVQFFGFVVKDSERMLVYEHMANGSLDKALFDDNNFLGWDLRVQIAIGAARGIAYLHEECRNQIVHCDIKPQNVLLDEAYAPKISDFGLAKLMGVDQTRTFTTTRGTRGYLAPEWYKNSAITAKVDVYGFGMMLLEIICCRKNLEPKAGEAEVVLSDWVYECFRHGRLKKLVEGQEVEKNAIEGRQLERMVLVGLWCIQEDPSLRPSMKKVVQMLEGSVEIAVPPPLPSFFESR